MESKKKMVLKNLGAGQERQTQANVHCSNIEIAKTWKPKKGP